MLSYVQRGHEGHDISAFYLNRCISDHIYIKEVSYGRSEDFD